MAHFFEIIFLHHYMDITFKIDDLTYGYMTILLGVSRVLCKSIQ